jgi:nucleoside-diphosphate-sugar epimerase
MKFLVTGGAGFIGSNMVDFLINHGHNVIVVDNLTTGKKENINPLCEFHNMDLYKENINELLVNVDYVIHMAAIPNVQQSIDQPLYTTEHNLSATIRLLNSIRKFPNIKKLVFSSTSAIYGNPIKFPVDETLPSNPLSPYGLQKLCSEQYIKMFTELYGINAVCLRYFNVFGPRQDIHRKSPPLINFIVREITNNRPITFFSDGNQQRDYIHVDDVVTMIDACINNPAAKQETFNLCSGTLTSVRDIIGYAERAFETKLEYNFEQPKEFWSGYPILKEGKPLQDFVLEHEVNKFSLGSRSKAEKMLDWKPNLHIEELMIDTMRKNYELYTK